MITTFATFPNGEWGDFNDCGDTSISYNWTIPLDINTTEPEWKVYVQNGSETNPWPYGKIGESDIFRIQPKDVSSASTLGSSTSAAIRETGASAVTTPTASQPPSGPAGSGLSTGAKAGIGVGVGIFAIFLAVGLFLLWRRRSRPVPSAEVPVAEQYEKPELESNPPRGGTRMLEAGAESQERYEIDGRGVKVLEQQPVELPAEQT